VSQLGLDRRIGGRMGRHAWPRGVFLNPEQISGTVFDNV